MGKINDLTPIIKYGDLIPYRDNVYRAVQYTGKCRHSCVLWDGARCPGTCTKYEGGENVVFQLAGPLRAFRLKDLTLTRMQQPQYFMIMNLNER